MSLGLAFASAPAIAHDFWIEPSTFRPAVGATVAVALRVGEEFRGDPVGRSAERIVKFVMRTPSGETAIPGEEGADPAGAARVGVAGLHVVGYRSNNARVELPADKFEQYLREEGLEKAIALRARRGESAKPSKERYSRCAKSLLSVGDSGAGRDVPLGFTLEIVSEANPYRARAGEKLPFRVLLRDKPAAGILVIALPRDAPASKLSGRTDSRGRVSLRLPTPGVWLLKAVHIEPLSGEDVDWESLWASSTFELPAVQNGRNPSGR